MVAAAAPSSARASRGLPAAPCRAGPERRPRGEEGVGPWRRGLCGRRDTSGERTSEGGREPGRHGRASAPTAPGPVDLFVWAALRPHQAR